MVFIRGKGYSEDLVEAAVQQFIKVANSVSRSGEKFTPPEFDWLEYTSFAIGVPSDKGLLVAYASCGKPYNGMNVDLLVTEDDKKRLHVENDLPCLPLVMVEVPDADAETSTPAGLRPGMPRAYLYGGYVVSDDPTHTAYFNETGLYIERE